MLHVVVLLEDPYLEESHKRQLQEMVAAADEKRQQVLTEGPGGTTDSSIVPHLVRGIAPGETIIEVAENINADLIIMGTHGRRGLSHLLLGSVAERVVRTARADVLTVRAETDEEPRTISRILVPHDFSDASMAAVRRAADWAKALGAELTLVHVVEPVVYPEFYAIDVISDDLMGRLGSRSERALSEVAEQQLGDLRTTVRIEVGRAADTIVSMADPEDFDLVVMATRGLSGLEHLLLGSVTESVLRRCRVPMLTVPGS
jgi:nucleotide-binding universal stress UspA family protein